MGEPGRSGDETRTSPTHGLGGTGDGPAAGGAGAPAAIDDAGHGNSAAAGSAAGAFGAEQAGPIADPFGDVLFHATRNAVYHVARRRRLEAYNRVGNFLVVVLGAAAAADLADDYGVPGSALALATAIVGALQLTFDFGGRARTHETLQRRYFEVLADISEHPNPDELQVAGWTAALYRIYGDEPPMLPVGNADAHNDAANALGRDPEERIVVPLRARLLGWIWPFDGSDWPTRRDLRGRREERRRQIRERWARLRHQQPPTGG